MKILKICCAVVGAGSLLTTTNLFASILGSGALNITAPVYNGPHGIGDQAGPYTISDVHVSSGIGPNFGTANNFETFCLGTTVDYTPSSSETQTPPAYGYQISSTIQPSSGSSGPGGGLNYITYGTAYLYSQFRAGATTFGSQSVTYPVTSGDVAIEENDALQAAIWTLQKQPDYEAAPSAGDFGNIYFYNGVTGSQPGMTSTEVAMMNQFLSLAETASGTLGNLTLAQADQSDGAFRVYALNLSNSAGWAQPQLCIVPEASTVYAGALLLLPFGASAFRIIRKKSMTA
jgi:hypothetical protein